MKVEKIECKPFYIKFRLDTINNEKQLQLSWHNKTKTRPNQDDDHKLYKFKNYYMYTLDQKDKYDFLKWYTNKDQLCTKYLYNFLTNTEDYYKKVVCIDIKEDNDWLNTNDIRYECDWKTQKISNIEVPSKLTIIKLEDGELITDYKASEKKTREAKAQQKAEFDIIDKILRPSFENILEKYGLYLNSDFGIKFKTRKDFNNFVKTSLKVIIDDLEQNGYIAKLNPRIQTIKYSSVIVNKKDLRMKIENKE